MRSVTRSVALGRMVAMDDRVRRFIEETAQDLVGLDVALFYQANPRTFDTPSGIALRTHRSVEEVEPALLRMCEQGYLESFTRGDGRYQVYALAPAPDVWRTLCLVSDAYHEDPCARKEIVLLLVQRRLEEKATDQNAGAQAPGSGTDGGAGA